MNTAAKTLIMQQGLTITLKSCRPSTTSYMFQAFAFNGATPESSSVTFEAIEKTPLKAMVQLAIAIDNWVETLS